MDRKMDEENIRYQNDLLHRLEFDQKHIMNTKVKNPLQKLSSSFNPNLSISRKQLDQKYNDYVNKKIIEKRVNDDEEHFKREKEKKDRLKEIQKYQQHQMIEKKAINYEARHSEKMLSKDIITRDLTNMATFDDRQRCLMKQKTELTKRLLDNQIRDNREIKARGLLLGEKEYALNATKIKQIIDKY